MTEENKKAIIDIEEDKDLTRDEMMMKVLKDSDPLEKEQIIKEIRAFVKRFPKTRYFILNSKKINYIAIFDTVNAKISEKTKHIYEYMEDSVFFDIDTDTLEDAAPTLVKMNNVKDIFTEEDGSLGMYIDTVYFRLYSGDGFVEHTKRVLGGKR